MTISLDYVSDFVCPWCWLGLRRLNAAIQEFDEEKVELKFRPFQLDASLPEEGMNYNEFMFKKFGEQGDDNKWTQMRSHLIQTGVEEDIPFNFNSLTIRANTFNAHRLMRWAQGQGYSTAAAETLFHAYFAENQNIGNKSTLISIGEQIGLLPDVLNKLFDEDEDKASLRDEETFFRNLGVDGVPVLIANGKKAIMGAQETHGYLSFLRSV
jgi:predicted DsbA family dithiol-disulfide isomerase